MAQSQVGSVVLCTGASEVVAGPLQICGVLCSAAAQTLTCGGIVIFTSPAAGYFDVQARVQSAVTVVAGADEEVTLYLRTN